MTDEGQDSDALIKFRNKSGIEIPKQLRNDTLRFCFVNCKIPFPTGWQEEKNTYKYDDEKLKERLKNGRSYGICGGFGNLMIVDADKPVVTDAFAIFGVTLTIETGHGEHLIFYVPGLDKSYALVEESKDSTPDNLQFDNIGHITSKGRMVVGPGCRHYNQIGHKNFEPSGETYKIVKDTDIRIITKEQMMAVIQPFLANKIRGNYEHQEKARTTDNVNTIEIPIKPIVEKILEEHPDWLRQASPGYRGHNPDHPKSKSRMDLAIDTRKNWWICGACATNGYGFGNSLYLIALFEGILHCHECKKGGLRGDKFQQLEKTL